MGNRCNELRSNNNVSDYSLNMSSDPRKSKPKPKPRASTIKTNPSQYQTVERNTNTNEFKRNEKQNSDSEQNSFDVANLKGAEGGRDIREDGDKQRVRVNNDELNFYDKQSNISHKEKIKTLNNNLEPKHQPESGKTKPHIGKQRHAKGDNRTEINDNEDSDDLESLEKEELVNMLSRLKQKQQR